MLFLQTTRSLNWLFLHSIFEMGSHLVAQTDQECLILLSHCSECRDNGLLELISFPSCTAPALQHPSWWVPQKRERPDKITPFCCYFSSIVLKIFKILINIADIRQRMCKAFGENTKDQKLTMFWAPEQGNCAQVEKS